MTAFDPEFTVHFHRYWLSTLRRIMQEAPLTPPYALGENTKRGDWDDLGEHHERQKPRSIRLMTLR